MSKEAYIERIFAAESMATLDKIAIEFFATVNERHAEYRYEVDLAIQRREAELQYILNQGQSEGNPIAGFDLTRRRVKTPITELAVSNLLPQTVKCGCKMKYGVLCIHKTCYHGVVPDSYHYCTTCGCDHEMDSRLAKEVHDKLGEPI